LLTRRMRLGVKLGLGIKLRLRVKPRPRITMFLAFKIIKKTTFRRLSEIDIDSGKGELDLPAILAEEREERAEQAK
jgi:hypothetical protein